MVETRNGLISSGETPYAFGAVDGLGLSRHSIFRCSLQPTLRNRCVRFALVVTLPPRNIRYQGCKALPGPTSTGWNALAYFVHPTSHLLR
jgi:hypothetical protein